MNPRPPIRLHAALRGGPRIGAWVAPLLEVSSLTACRVGFRFGGLPVPNH